MKKLSFISFLTLMLFIVSCSKKDGSTTLPNNYTLTPPTLLIDSFRNITTSSITFTLKVTVGGSPITDRGVVWGGQGSSVMGPRKISLGPGSGSNVITISGLNSRVGYYTRGYATDYFGNTKYSNEVFFSTN